MSGEGEIMREELISLALLEEGHICPQMKYDIRIFYHVGRWKWPWSTVPGYFTHKVLHSAMHYEVGKVGFNILM